ncbi:oxidoreductase [Denitrobacterium detoxificans]|uniref:Dihydroorotate oxidase B, electron transfer subunit n=1 Tax=Denitrobacterium detoxificans TaxID=79604 RepID=A0A172RYI5_9ACTN|nr:dihydroorotate dehydrogenase electron transfer subunit [Denitrobacterium detoxificans]ANE22752.1 oxidoreductase [Denitrobacterium detoxificans]SEO77793.1 dihydroorotate oxidase B, electron transfer subunit [Denitrobacterium detoxificans]
MCCEDRSGLIHERITLLSNEKVGPRLFVMRVESPRIAQALLPGQFTHVRIPQMESHILRRPFSVYETFPEEGTMDILYQVVGYGTEFLSQLPAGTQLDQIGPIGRPWDAPEGETRVLAVAGGAGAPATFMQVKRCVEAGVPVDVVLGAQNASALVTRERYAALLGADPVCATDDGSYGFKGFATIPAAELMQKNEYSRVITCGPEPLMRAVANSAAEAGIACQVSMERRMACGVGACLSCVVETAQGKKRACVDGPIFEADQVVW